jgi:hypothetical protein
MGDIFSFAASIGGVELFLFKFQKGDSNFRQGYASLVYLQRFQFNRKGAIPPLQPMFERAIGFAARAWRHGPQIIMLLVAIISDCKQSSITRQVLF